MTDSLVERVARAIAFEDATLGASSSSFNENDVWQHSLTGEQRARYLLLARAAIGAMREPTTEMSHAGWNVEQPDANIPNIWRAMIDKALKDEKPPPAA